MKRKWAVICGILGLTACIGFLLKEKTSTFTGSTSSPRFLPPAASTDLPYSATSVDIEEDPGARARYEHMLLADPSGKIPPGIRHKEVAFSKSLITRQDLLKKKGARTKERTYIPRGPFNVGGRTRALAIDRSNENTIIAGGVSGGIWRSGNEGGSWVRVTPPDMINSVSCLVQDLRPGELNTWYFGTGEYSVFNSARANNATPYRGDGIYKSTDGGLTWAPLSATVSGNTATFGSPFQYVYKIALNNANTARDEIYAATVGGVIQSLDGGETWTTVLGVDLLNEAAGADLNNRSYPFFSEIAINGAGTKYAAIGSVANTGNDWQGAGLFTSEDGKQWREITPTGFPEQFRRVVITPSPTDDRVMYVLADAAKTNLWKATFLPGGGSLWQDLSGNIPDFGGRVGEFNTQNGYNMLLEIHPEDEKVIFLGGTNLYRSDDGFTTAQNTFWIGGYDTSNTARQYPDHHADQHVLGFYQGDKNKLLSGHDGGISMTTNGLADEVKWVSLNNGYITSQFFTIDIPKFETSGLIVGGMQDNGTYLKSAPGELPAWNQIFSGDGSYCQTTPDGTFWYVSAQLGQIYRLTFNSTYQLTGYARIDPIGGGLDPDNGYLFVNPFRLDPINSNIMYLAGGNTLWKNSNLSQITNGSQNKTGANWSKLSKTKVPEGQITSLDLSITGERQLLYGNSTGQLFKITELETPGMKVGEITSPLFPKAFLSAISIDPSNSQHCLIVFSNYGIPSLFFSGDGGQTFEDVSGNLEENPDGTGNGPSVRWAQLIPLQGGRLMGIAGTSTGLYVAEELNGNQTTWTREGVDLIGFAVVPMLSYDPLDGRLAIATHGNGVFETFIEGHQSVEKPEQNLSFTTSAPYPNPFHDVIHIPLEIPSTQIIRAFVYDASGKPVKALVWGTQFGGNSTLTWDGTNVTGTPVADGVYFCRIQLETGSEKTVRLMLRH